MKTRALIIIALLALAGFTMAQSRRGLLMSRGSGGTGGGSDACTDCTNETFEGTGTSVAGWKYGDNSAGIVTNIDYTTSPAPIIGSQSALLKNADSQAAYLNLTVATASEHWVRMAVIFTNTVVNNMRIFTAEDNVGGRNLELRLVSGTLRVTHGSATATTASTMSANTVTYIWVHYLKGSGANGVADVGFSTTKTRPTTGGTFASLSNGTAAADTVDIYLNVSDFSFGSGIAGVIYDDVSFSRTGVIGNYP